MAMSLDYILCASRHALLLYLRQGCPFVSPKLNALYVSGRVILKEAPEPGDTPVEVWYCQSPLTWLRADEVANATPIQRIALAGALLTNTYAAHDDALLEKIGSQRAVFFTSNLYRWHDTTQHPEGSSMTLLSAYRLLPE